MEHLSRRTSGKVDMLYLVTDYSLRGLRALKRINGMLENLQLKVGKVGMVVTRCPAKLGEAFVKEAEEIGLEIIGRIPDDPALLDFEGSVSCATTE